MALKPRLPRAGLCRRDVGLTGARFALEVLLGGWEPLQRGQGDDRRFPVLTKPAWEMLPCRCAPAPAHGAGGCCGGGCEPPNLSRTPLQLLSAKTGLRRKHTPPILELLPVSVR